MPSSIGELLEKLGNLEIEIKLDGDRFSVSAPKGALTREIQEEIRNNKSEIIAALRAEKPRPMDGNMSFWQQLLANSVAELEIAFDTSRGVTKPNFSEISSTIATSFTGTVDRDVLLFTAFQITVARLASHYDVISAFNSDSDRYASLSFSPFPVRTYLAENPSISSALQTVGKAVDLSASNNSSDLSAFLEAVKASREMSGLPAFQTSFNYIGKTTDSSNDSHSELIADSDIALTVVDHNDSIELKLRYNSTIQIPRTAESFLVRFKMVLDAINSDQSVGILSFPFITPDEYEEIIVGWNQTPPEIQKRSRNEDYRRCVHKIIEDQVARTGERIAITDGQNSLTYKEMDNASNKLAHALIDQGVKRGDKVGICVTRSPNIIIAALATWKAGAAYVPLDNTYPKDRLAYMAQDSNIQSLITEENLAALVDIEDSSIPTILLDVDRAKIESYPDTPPSIECSPEDVAYIIYTSGSTGRPKGVLVHHRGVANQIISLRQITGFSETDNFFSVTAMSFDVSITEYFMPLITGAKVTIAPFQVGADGSELKALIQATRPTYLQATPARWRLILDAGWNDGAGMTLCTGGEPLTKELAASLLNTGGTLWNLYGPTEITVYSHFQKIVPDAERIYIGRPVPNYTCYILNEVGQPIPPNVLGEIYIGGASVAHGYINREDLTQEKFLPDPFTDGSYGNNRMYRSGDQGRYNRLGEVDCTGRLDNQVKIRGFRIELGEIESQLVQHESVNEAVVIVREDSAGDRRLVGYVQLYEGFAFNAEVLKSVLSEQLPPYMIPGVIVSIDKFPLTPSGKIDRRNLPAPKIAREYGAAFVTPKAGLESQVAAIWKGILNIEKVGATENFFDIGGDSLLAARLQNEIQNHFQISFPLVELFRSPTIGGVTKFISGKLGLSDSTQSSSFTSRAKERAMLQNRTSPKN